MGVIALVVTAWYGPRSRIYTVCVGLVGVGTILISGSRTASVVMILLLLTARGLRLPWAGRLVLAGSVLALLALFSLTPGFQNRWFNAGEGSLWSIVTNEDLQTSGRADVWPVIANSCHHTVLGEGAGASDSFASAANQGFPEPHNEYLRIWCDTGLVGSVLFWGFVAVIGLHAIGGMRRSRRIWSHPAAAQMVAALLLLSVTDNPLTTAVPFMIPAALAFGWSEHDQEPGENSFGRSRGLKLPRIKHAGRP
jgi:O-antigen ligase